MISRRLLSAATLATATLLLIATPSAAAADPLEVEVVGGGPLLEVTDMYPGFETSSVLQVTNTTSEAGNVNLRVTDVVSDDNGCNRPEARVDSTCGGGEGELGEQVVLSVERQTSGGQFDDILTEALLGSLDVGVVLEDELDGGDSGRYRFTLALPVTSGNETQTDSVDFNVEIFGQSLVTTGVPIQPVGPTERLAPTTTIKDRIDQPPGTTPDVLDDGVDRAPDPRQPGEVVAGTTELQVRASTGSLPRTGLQLLELLAAGVTVVLAGTAAVMLANARRRRI